MPQASLRVRSLSSPLQSHAAAACTGRCRLQGATAAAARRWAGAAAARPASGDAPSCKCRSGQACRPAHRPVPASAFPPKPPHAVQRYSARQQQRVTAMSTAAPLPELAVAFVTVPSKEVGKKLAASLVEQRLAACVNIIPGEQSVRPCVRRRPAWLACTSSEFLCPQVILSSRR